MTSYRDQQGDVWALCGDGLYRAPGLSARSYDYIDQYYGPLAQVDGEPAPATLTREEALNKAAGLVDRIAGDRAVPVAQRIGAALIIANFLVGGGGE